MKRRDFLKGLAATPALVVLPAIAKNKNAYYERTEVLENTHPEAAVDQVREAHSIVKAGRVPTKDGFIGIAGEKIFAGDGVCLNSEGYVVKADFASKIIGCSSNFASKGEPVTTYYPGEFIAKVWIVEPR